MFKQSYRLLRQAMSYERQILKYICLVVGLEILEIAGLYKLNMIRGDLYHSIQNYLVDDIWKAIFSFCIIAAGLVITGGYLGFLINRLSFYIRTGLTKFYISLEARSEISNFEQRIQEDLRKFGDLSVEFWIAIFRSSCKLPLFLGVIITLTKWYIGVGIILAVVGGTYLTKLVAARLAILQAVQEGNEAEFRKNLTLSLYKFIEDQFNLINQRLKYLSFTQSGLSQAFVLLPFISLLPLYIAKTLDLGGFFRSVDALARVIDALTVFIDNRQLLVNIQTVLHRISVLDRKM